MDEDVNVYEDEDEDVYDPGNGAPQRALFEQ